MVHHAEKSRPGLENFNQFYYNYYQYNPKYFMSKNSTLISVKSGL